MSSKGLLMEYFLVFASFLTILQKLFTSYLFLFIDFNPHLIISQNTTVSYDFEDCFVVITVAPYTRI